MAKKFESEEEKKEYFRVKQEQSRLRKADLEKRPGEATEREWAYACERADRARVYAEKFPEFVLEREAVYRDAMWQWENEVKGRMKKSA